MKMTSEQLDNLTEIYVEKILEGMDVKTMENLIFDMMTDKLSYYTQNQLIDEIAQFYENELPEMIESVGAVPEEIL